MIGGRKHEAQNKSTAIQIPPLHTTLIETHQEFAKVTHKAKSIAKICKRIEKASNKLHQERPTTIKANEELTR